MRGTKQRVISMETDLTHWLKAETDTTLTYTYKDGENFIVIQQKGVKGNAGTSLTNKRTSDDPPLPQEAFQELIEDIKQYD